MAGRLFLISVGTSLLGKVNQDFSRGSDPLPNEERDWLIDKKFWSRELSRRLQQVADSKMPHLAAELSSLFKDPIYPQPTAADEFLLLHTATTMGAVCADGVASLLRRKLGNNVQVACYEVEGLSEAQSNEFYAQGLPNLLAKLQDELDRAQANRREVILVPTGGYKAIIPYFVIMGLLYDCPCLYVYEDSDLVATLPPLPLHADLARWSSLEAVIETLTGKPADQAKRSAIYQDNAPMLTLILQKRDGFLQPSPLCQVLQAKVTAERRRSELEFRTQHSPLLPYLIKTKGDDSRDPTLQEYFLRLAAIGPYIWKGDRVPEMADHALLHHADLFHLAERLLLPVFYWYEQENRVFLSPEELFVLLGALHLHDCGHVVGTVDLSDGTPRQLLPTEVRDHHHVLGYLRLTEPEKHGGTGQWLHDALQNSQIGGRAWEDAFRENALEAIATVGLFHRKAMKLKKNGVNYEFLADTPLAVILPLNEFLSDKTLQIGETILAKDRIPLLVALLRLIDSLDEQASRTGGTEAVRFHLELMDTEAREEEDRAAGLGQALTAWAKALAALCPPGCQEIQSDLAIMVDRLFGTYKDKESKPEQKDPYLKEKLTPDAGAKPTKYTNRQFWSEFNEKVPEKSNGQDNPLRPLALEYVKAKLRAKFKGFQKEPYEEKLPIEGISLDHEIKDDKIHFTIDLVIEPGYPNAEERRRDMLANLKKEYDQENVAAILDDAGIVLHYGRDAA